MCTSQVPGRAAPGTQQVPLLSNRSNSQMKFEPLQIPQPAPSRPAHLPLQLLVSRRLITCLTTHTCLSHRSRYLRAWLEPDSLVRMDAHLRLLAYLQTLIVVGPTVGDIVNRHDRVVVALQTRVEHVFVPLRVQPDHNQMVYIHPCAHLSTLPQIQLVYVVISPWSSVVNVAPSVTKIV